VIDVLRDTRDDHDEIDFLDDTDFREESEDGDKLISRLCVSAI
jgi:hypothetical protein